MNSTRMSWKKTMTKNCSKNWTKRRTRNYSMNWTKNYWMNWTKRMRNYSMNWTKKMNYCSKNRLHPTQKMHKQPVQLHSPMPQAAQAISYSA
jgi:hypothetical protein